jgi:RNA polymerase sigma factor (sigma-70 family)
MTETTWAALRELLVSRYDELRRRLARRLGSAELAAETLHETWLRLNRAGTLGAVERPESYLFRIALNVAADRRQLEARRLALSEIEMLRHLDDDELDPERMVQARSDIKVLAQALGELPPRCRAIFIAVRLEEMPYKIAAERFGISVRGVEREVKRALDHCAARLDKKLPRPVGSRAPDQS